MNSNRLSTLEWAAANKKKGGIAGLELDQGAGFGLSPIIASCVCQISKPIFIGTSTDLDQYWLQGNEFRFLSDKIQSLRKREPAPQHNALKYLSFKIPRKHQLTSTKCPVLRG